MCRMFGMVATKSQSIAPWIAGTSPSLRSLSVADRSGEPNPDGWGIGWYEAGEESLPLVVKEPAPASESLVFDETARRVTARIALAHIRRSSRTPRMLTNTHPFTSGRWLFCHNGYCSRERLVEHLLPSYRDRLQGANDSEAYFALLLQHMEATADVAGALRSAVQEVVSVGDYTGLNFLLSDGTKIYAFHYSVDPQRHGMVLHHDAGRELVASEPVGAGSWEDVPNGTLATVTASGYTFTRLV